VSYVGAGSREGMFEPDRLTGDGTIQMLIRIRAIPTGGEPGGEDAGA